MQLSNSLTPRSVASSNYLLRKYGGAAAAYSLQRLDTSVENVVRARRSTDDAEADFTAQEVSGGSLREFALNNDADLVRFADQAVAADERMYFDGSNDHVRAPGIDAGETGDFTATCYFTPSSFGAFEQILSNSNTIGSIAFELRLSTTPVLQAGITIGSSFKSATGSTTLVAGTTYRVGIRRSSDQLEVWLNGVKDGSATHVGARDAQSLFCVGCRNNTQLFANGLIYDVKYWDSAISEAEMLVDGTGGVPATSPTSYLLGYGNTDADWEDQIGSNDGTVNGTPALFSGQGFDAYVTTLYDQSGNGRNATQATAASQPQIVADGVVVTDADGIPAMSFDGVNDKLGVSGETIITGDSTGEWSGFSVQEITIADIGYVYGNTAGGGAGTSLRIVTSPTSYTISNAATTADYIARGLTKDLVSTCYNNGDAKLKLNGGGTPVSGSYTYTAATLDFTIGDWPNSSVANSAMQGKISEIVIYPTDEDANRAAIEANIASRYGITI